MEANHDTMVIEQELQGEESVGFSVASSKATGGGPGRGQTEHLGGDVSPKRSVL